MRGNHYHFRIPTGSVTPTAIIVGWSFMMIGALLSFIGPEQYQAILGEFLSYVPRWLFVGLMFVSGFFIAKPGERHRTLKHMAGVVCCFWWIGVCLLPLFTHSGNPISVIGVIIWLAFATLLAYDARSAAYDPVFQQRACDSREY